MRHALALHPDSTCNAVARIDVETRRRARSLSIDYLVTGNIGNLRFAGRGASARADELWLHTCFEAFLREGAKPSYFEFNYSPSFQWQTYSFRSYREGRSLPGIAEPQLRTSVSANVFELNVMLSELPFPENTGWQLGLAAVIEEANGGKSYWALAHPAGKPDFHHTDSFALELPPG